jgi:hypothetical protein
MCRPDRSTLLAALAFTLALPACGGDSTSPVVELTLAQVVAQCSRGGGLFLATTALPVL